MDDTQLSLALYVNKASDLAEAVRHNIQHNDGKISPETVLALNSFIVAANQIKDLTDLIQTDSMILN